MAGVIFDQWVQVDSLVEGVCVLLTTFVGRGVYVERGVRVGVGDADVWLPEMLTSIRMTMTMPIMMIQP